MGTIKDDITVLQDLASRPNTTVVRTHWREMMDVITALEVKLELARKALKSIEVHQRLAAGESMKKMSATWRIAVVALAATDITKEEK